MFYKKIDTENIIDINKFSMSKLFIPEHLIRHVGNSYRDEKDVFEKHRNSLLSMRFGGDDQKDYVLKSDTIKAKFCWDRFGIEMYDYRALKTILKGDYPEYIDVDTVINVKNTPDVMDRFEYKIYKIKNREMLEDLERIGRLDSIETVVCCVDLPLIIDILEKCKNLTKIEFNWQITDINGIERLRRLRKISMFCSLDTSPLKNLSNIEFISGIKNCEIKDILHMKKLKYLKLDYVSDGSINELSELTDIEYLIIQNKCMHPFNNAQALSIDFVRDLKKLRYIKIIKIRPFIEPLKYLTGIEYFECHDLQNISLDPLTSSADSLKVLKIGEYNRSMEFLQKMRNLKVFHFHNSEVDTTYFRYLTNIRELNICEIYDMASFKELVNLETLHIDKVIDSLEGIQNLHKLKHLSFGRYFNKKIDLLQKLRNLKTVRFGAEFERSVLPLVLLKNLELIVLSPKYSNKSKKHNGKYDLGLTSFDKKVQIIFSH